MSKIELLAGELKAGESSKAIQACNDWLRLGPGRTLTGLLEKYRDTPENAATSSLNTLQAWSKGFDWMSRGKLYDKELERQKNERRREILESGLALDFERVTELKNIALVLKAQFYHRDESGRFDSLWLKDVKQVGTGESARVVNIERFNAPLISELRGILDDLAKETGGRRQRVDTRQLNIDVSQLSDEQIEALAAGEDYLSVISSNPSPD